MEMRRIPNPTNTIPTQQPTAPQKKVVGLTPEERQELADLRELRELRRMREYQEPEQPLEPEPQPEPVKPVVKPEPVHDIKWELGQAAKVGTNVPFKAIPTLRPAPPQPTQQQMRDIDELLEEPYMQEPKEYPQDRRVSHIAYQTQATGTIKTILLPVGIVIGGMILLYFGIFNAGGFYETGSRLSGDMARFFYVFQVANIMEICGIGALYIGATKLVTTWMTRNRTR